VKRNRDFPVREHVSALRGDSLPRIAARVQAYAVAIGDVAHDRLFETVMPPTDEEPRAVGAEVLSAVESLLAHAWDLIDPP
jgi:IMP cyclohydrolase